MKLAKALLIVLVLISESGRTQETCANLAGGPTVSGAVVSDEQILALLESDTWSPYHREEIQRIFSSSNIVRPRVAFRLFARQAMRYPGITEMAWAAGILERSIQTEVPTASVRDFSEVDPKDLLVAIHNGAAALNFGNWTQIFKFGRRFQTEEAFQETLQFGVSVLQRRLESSGAFPGLSQYLRYKLIKESVKRELGLEFDLISDVATFETSSGVYSVVAYATVPIEGKIGAFGFGYKTLGEVQGDSGEKSHRFQWEAGGQANSATVRLKMVGKSSLAPSYAYRPDYKGMLKDGKLTGMILFSKNLSEFLEELVPTYEEYLESEGFKKRSDQVLPFADAQNFIFSRVQKMEIDYMLKEGHGHPSAWGLIDLSVSVRILTYRSSQETIYLVLPADPSGQSSHVSVDQLGAALRARSRPTQEFLYIDTGCRAENDLCSLTKGVAAPGFTPIGSGQDVTTFTSADGDAVYEILHGLRNKRSYRTISKSILVRDHSGRKIDHGFVFPDSQGYVVRKNGGELNRVAERYSVQVHVGR